MVDGVYQENVLQRQYNIVCSQRSVILEIYECLHCFIEAIHQGKQQPRDRHWLCYVCFIVHLNCHSCAFQMGTMSLTLKVLATRIDALRHFETG